MTACVALFRGINVGTANRIAMSDLRHTLTALGLKNVRTLLNSGNAIFEVNRPNRNKLAKLIHTALADAHQIACHVIVCTESDIAEVIQQDPLGAHASDPSRYLVAFVADAAVIRKVKDLEQQAWEPDRIVVLEKAAYLWCPDNIHDNKMVKAFSKGTGNLTTTRNWATVLKIRDEMKRTEASK